MDIQYIPAQETAKRALEIAASGIHFITLSGSEGECRYLRAAFPSIGGNLDLVRDNDADIFVEVPETDEADLLLPAPAESSATIKKRVTDTRKILRDTNTYPTPATIEILSLAEERGHNKERMLRVARTLAAMDRSPRIERIHIAEALCYTQGIRELKER